MITSNTLTRMPVRTSDTAQERLNYLNMMCSMSWREIAALPEYSGIKAGSLCSFAAGTWEPKNAVIRARLGLPPLGHVTVIFGIVPDGSQVLAAQQCACGRWYISNHPARQRCFICAPYRGRRR